MNVGITGHLDGPNAGFIGRWLADELQIEGGHTVRELPEDIRQGYTAGGNLAELDAVVHLAARVGRERCELNPRDVVDTNAWGTFNVAQACATAGVRLLYVSSSEAAYAGNLYGLTKRWGEDAARLALRDRPHDLLVARLFMPYGPGHPPGNGRAALTNWVWQAMHGLPLVAHRDTSRSWCWVGDTVHALRLILERWEIVPDTWSGVLNVGRVDNVASSWRVARRVVELLGSRSAVDLVDRPAGIVDHKLPPVDALYHWLGWSPTVELDEGIILTRDWLETLRDE